ncbi:helix-turn-helix transcriptional regulator [Altererythrobacter sp. CC-YST694]|uniref:winged helix-turn-helix transcriptional regulator n=1 Tax=Altererythrobacter sp. CC-YST694 TaxID=2755038 RepID=UPI001D006847|nr:helix-turn-helix domain-containing protein [Altererythrobacter sp. CC-YST694]MCB5424900.1 helix-turn-helix transcriptional regulator [Altererythrobacter sp. CC-YST694]
MKSLKETSSSQECHGKWYGDACGTAFAMEVVGERWSLLIVRELLLGGRRFSDLRRVLPGISAKVLTERLAGLEAAGVLVKRLLPPPASTQVYELTEWGYTIEPAVQELGRWAARSVLHDPMLPLSAVSLMISMRTMLDREGAKAFDAVVGFDVAGEMFVAELRDGELSIRRIDALDAPVIFRAQDAMAVAALLYPKIPMEVLEAEAGLVVEGDRELAKRYAALFSLPPKIGAPAGAP